MNQIIIDKNIERIILRLKRFQKSDGSWTDNNFINALIAHSLITTTESTPKKQYTFEVKKMLDKTLAVILQEKSPSWSWNYHPQRNIKATKTSNNYQTGSQYPNDMDDTSCSLIAILKTKPALIDEKALTHIEKLFTITSSDKLREKGPYLTWITEKQKKWKDIDPAVNANINYFLWLRKITSPSITTYIDAVIREEKYHSLYYDNPLFVIYFITRGYQGKERQRLVLFIHRSIQSTNNSTYQILGICSLLRLGVSALEILPLFENISIQQIQNGNPLYIEKISNGIKTYARSVAFDRAIKAEMYSLFKKTFRQEKEYLQIKHKQDKQNIEVKIKRMIKNKIDHRLQQFPIIIRNKIKTIVSKTTQTRSEKNSVLIPFNIAWSMQKTRPTDLTTVTTMGMVNLFGWIAYTIYDNILDEKVDGTNRQLLPIANILHREMIVLIFELFQSNGKPSTPKVISKFFNAFNIFDIGMYITTTTNWFENNKLSKQIMIPSIQSMIDKSSGYMLPALLTFQLLQQNNNARNKSDANHLSNFFKNLIFIRQMSDDIHDWKEDIDKGILTRVSSRVLIIFQKKYPHITTINPSNDFNILEKIFSEHVFNVCIKEMSASIKKADRDLHSIRAFTTIDFFENLLQTYKDALRKYSKAKL